VPAHGLRDALRALGTGLLLMAGFIFVMLLDALV
jgi:hypothetical protein